MEAALAAARPSTGRRSPPRRASAATWVCLLAPGVGGFTQRAGDGCMAARRKSVGVGDLRATPAVAWRSPRSRLVLHRGLPFRGAPRVERRALPARARGRFHSLLVDRGETPPTRARRAEPRGGAVAAAAPSERAAAPRGRASASLCRAFVPSAPPSRASVQSAPPSRASAPSAPTSHACAPSAPTSRAGVRRRRRAARACGRRRRAA